MKKLILLILTIAGFLFFNSCNKEDDHEVTDSINKGDSFFNLKVGNVWVYNRYTYIVLDDQGTIEQKFRGTDTVKVVNKTKVGEKLYYEMSSKRYNEDGRQFQIGTENYFVRTNSLGHLVGINGKLIHPGDDTNSENYFIDEEPSGFLFGKGTLTREMVGPISDTINGQSYKMYYYKHTYKIDEHFAKDKTDLVREYGDYYTKNVGMVKELCVAFSTSDVTYERHLVKYYNELDAVK